MAPGGPPGAGRGRGGKFKKFTRGGGKNFSKNLRPLDADGNDIMIRNADGSSSEDEDSSEEDSPQEEVINRSDMTREERRAAAKAKKEAAIARRNTGKVEAGDLPTSSEEESDMGDMPANPNHSKAARNQAKSPANAIEETTEKTKELSIGGQRKAKPTSELSRREREALQAQQAKERYQKLHEAGKTDEARADLARLKLIREKREAEASRKQAEKEEREEADKARKAATEARETKRREAALGLTKSKGKSKK